MHKLSICIPTRNRPQELLKTVSEIQTQIAALDLYDKVEIVVADNTDQPELFIKSHQIAAANLRYVVNEGNLGYARNINRAISMADGEYVWLLSDDDIIQPQAVEKIYHALVDQQGGEVNYLTFFSGVHNGDDIDENFYFKGCDQFYFENGDDFLVRYWKSIIFVSINIFHRERLVDFAREYGLFDNINDVFQNSLMNIGFVSKFGKVRIIPDLLLLDSYEDKLYTPFNSINIPILNYTKLLCQLRKQGISSKALLAIKEDVDMSILFNGLRFSIRKIETADDFDYAGCYARLFSFSQLYFSSKVKVAFIWVLLKLPQRMAKFLIKMTLSMIGKNGKYDLFKEEGRLWYQRLQAEKVKVSY